MYICNMYNVYTPMSVDCDVCEYLFYSSNKECLYCNIYAFLAHFETEYIIIYLYIDVELLLNKYWRWLLSKLAVLFDVLRPVMLALSYW